MQNLCEQKNIVRLQIKMLKSKWICYLYCGIVQVSAVSEFLNAVPQTAGIISPTIHMCSHVGRIEPLYPFCRFNVCAAGISSAKSQKLMCMLAGQIPAIPPFHLSGLLKFESGSQIKANFRFY